MTTGVEATRVLSQVPMEDPKERTSLGIDVSSAQYLQDRIATTTLGRALGNARTWASSTWRSAAEAPNRSELTAIALVYLVQGVTDLAVLGQKYMLKDEMGASPAEVALILSAASLPWAIKPLIGLLSDCVPLGGYRRKSYLVAAGLTGALGWLLLSSPSLSPGPAAALAFIFLTSAASAVSDVVVDSMVVERARRESLSDSGSLQSLCWASYAVGQIGSAYWSGALIENLGPRRLFLLTSLLPLLVVAVGLGVREERGPGVLQRMRGMWAAAAGAPSPGPEEQQPAAAHGLAAAAAGPSDGSAAACAGLSAPAAHGAAARGKDDGFWEEEEEEGEQGPGSDARSDRVPLLPQACGFMGASHPGPRNHIGGHSSSEGDVELSATLRHLSHHTAGPSGLPNTQASPSIPDGHPSSTRSAHANGYIHLRARPHGPSRLARLAAATRSAWASAGVVEGAAALWATVRRREVAAPVLFLFCSSATPGADDAMFFFMTERLQFSATFLGDVQLAVAVASLIGVGVYHAFLRAAPLRRVLLGGTLVAAVVQASSLVLATRANVALGLDDHLFALGDSVAVSVIQNVLFMPTMVLSARLCPPGMEATLFAGLMSIGNIAQGVRTASGAMLMHWLGITATDFTHLPTLLTICSVGLLVPLPLLALVPSSLDRDAKEGEGAAGGAAAAGAAAAAEGPAVAATRTESRQEGRGGHELVRGGGQAAAGGAAGLAAAAHGGAEGGGMAEHGWAGWGGRLHGAEHDEEEEQEEGQSEGLALLGRAGEVGRRALGTSQV